MPAPRPAPAPHPLRRWFAARGWTPFPFQEEAWAAHASGASGLIHAATGTGKTYAAWGGALLDALRAGEAVAAGAPAPPLRALWITPLRALAADTELALREAVEGAGVAWTVESRTGDTAASVRARQRERLPSALVTTPESLALLLTRPDHPALLAGVRTVVVDEWHELMASKRGVQVELALARLRAVAPALRTWGLSATLGNLEVAADTLLGVGHGAGAPPRRLIRGLVPKAVVVEALIPDTIERFPWAGHLNTRLLPEVMRRLAGARSAIVFCNTRSQAELWFQSLIAADPSWFEFTAIHHGSLDREQRETVERGLKSGRFRVVVATSSLDLGVDFAPVELVLQVGSPKGVARLLQRAGRSGHAPGRPSRIVCVPTHALELVEVAAARDAIAAGAIESRDPVDRPLDLLAQHLVTLAVGGGFTRAGVLAELRTTRAYAALTEAELDWVLDFVTRGGDALQAYPEYGRVAREGEGEGEGKDARYVVTDAAVARRHRLAIGTIVSDAAITVRYVGGGRLGTVEEGFIARLSPGDTFLFAGTPLEFVRVRDLTAWVRRARGITGAIPRWAGARMPLSTELARAVRDTLDAARRGTFASPEMAAMRPLLALQAERSIIPAPDELLMERCRTREGHHLFVYPFDGRLVHEGLAALLAYRLAQLAPATYTFACNDYGFDLLAPEPAPLEEALAAGLLAPAHLLHDITASLNAAELAKRQFREIARVAGLVFGGFPGASKTVRQLQASSGLLYEVFVRHDPGNLLLHQAQREVLERQLEASRLGRVLERLSRATWRVVEVERPTPLAFPLLVDMTRGTVSSEKLADRVRRMVAHAEGPAGRRREGRVG